MAATANFVAQATRNVQEYLYDFDVQAGAQGVINLGYLPVGAVVVNAVAVVETTATSDGSATVIFGTTTDDNAFIASTAVAAIVAGKTLGNTVAANAVQANATADQAVNMTIGTADLKTGVIRLMLEYYVPSNVVLSV